MTDDYSSYIKIGFIIFLICTIALSAYAYSLSYTVTQQEETIALNENTIISLSNELASIKSNLTTTSQRDLDYLAQRFAAYVNSTAVNVTDWTQWRMVGLEQYPEPPSAPRLIVQTWNHTYASAQIAQFYFVNENVWSQPVVLNP